MHFKQFKVTYTDSNLSHYSKLLFHPSLFLATFFSPKSVFYLSSHLSEECALPQQSVSWNKLRQV